MDQCFDINLANQLHARFGPIIGGGDLYAALGFKTYAAFHRSQRRNELGVHVFGLPRRRGWFALTDEVARWLSQQAASNMKLSSTPHTPTKNHRT